MARPEYIVETINELLYTTSNVQELLHMPKHLRTEFRRSCVTGMTYVLNTRSLKDKLFVEIGDSGLMALMKNPMHFAPGKYPVGTMDGENNGSKTSRNFLSML